MSDGLFGGAGCHADREFAHDVKRIAEALEALVGMASQALFPETSGGDLIERAKQKVFDDKVAGKKSRR